MSKDEQEMIAVNARVKHQEVKTNRCHHNQTIEDINS